MVYWTIKILYAFFECLEQFIHPMCINHWDIEMNATREYDLRPATQSDEATIRALVNGEHLNPMGLEWSNFIVAVLPSGEIIGCGQIKPHRDGSHELSSLVVASSWRSNGVARAIIEHLIATHSGTLFLTCRLKLRPLYEKFGFRVAEKDEMTPYFRNLSRLAKGISLLTLGREGMLVMIRSGG